MVEYLQRIVEYNEGRSYFADLAIHAADKGTGKATTNLRKQRIRNAANGFLILLILLLPQLNKLNSRYGW
jgi:hypothetical protein